MDPENRSDEEPRDEIEEDEAEELVDNINEGDETGTVKGGSDEGADNIRDTKNELREDMKNDSLGGAPQLGEQQVADEDEELPQRSG